MSNRYLLGIDYSRSFAVVGGMTVSGVLLDYANQDAFSGIPQPTSIRHYQREYWFKVISTIAETYTVYIDTKRANKKRLEDNVISSAVQIMIKAGQQHPDVKIETFLNFRKSENSRRLFKKWIKTFGGLPNNVELVEINRGLSNRLIVCMAAGIVAVHNGYERLNELSSEIKAKYHIDIGNGYANDRKTINFLRYAYKHKIPNLEKYIRTNWASWKRIVKYGK